MVLPVFAVIDEIKTALADIGAAVLVAPPGAGKTTVVPLQLLDTPWRTGKILVLEPRRLAARAAASRMAAELGERVGQTVGVRTRGDSRVGPSTRIEVVTEGILTRMVVADPSLTDVSAVIFDEYHERSIDADFGLACCIESRALVRPDLRLLVMSATLDAAACAQLLGDAPVIASEGRIFPVDIVWCPPQTRQTWERAVADNVERALVEQTEGDVLVFLPGIGEIRRVHRLLQHVAAEVIELHGGLDSGSQDQALHIGTRRRVVLATAIAQTSVTLPGVTAVVDGGLARRSRFDPRRGIGGLVTEPVSQAAAEQRRGRAGRVRPGRCYRVWSESSHRALPAFDPPEMLTADLTGLALDLAAWGGIDDGRWLDPPPAGPMAASVRLLQSLDGLDGSGRITDHGRRLSELGLHPRLGHLLLCAAPLGYGALAATLAALLSERDILTGPPSVRPTDLRERLVALRNPTTMTDRSTRERVLADARRFADRAGSSAVHDSATDDATGVLLGFAFPDRLARRRTSGTRFVLANGSGATLDTNDPLARATFLSIAELDVVTGQADAHISMAAPVEAADIISILGNQLTWHDDVRWDRRTGDVVSSRQRRFGALVVEEDHRAKPSPEAAAAALLDGVRTEGISLLGLSTETERWRHRVAACHHYLGNVWPDLSDLALITSLDDWLRPLLSGCNRRGDLAHVDVNSAVRALLPWPLPRDLDNLAPTHLTAPSGSRIAIDYAAEIPTLAVKLQELFGLSSSPQLASGRIPLVIHLLSPARRPLQVTADLASFWAGAYPAVRAEMRGKYPRHPWPEDPTTATPTAKVTPRRK